MTHLIQTCKLIGVGCLLLSAVCAIVLLTDVEHLRPMGELVRRADDVTPERVARLRVLCGFFSVVWVVIGVLMLRHPLATAQVIDEFRRELFTLTHRAISATPLIAWGLITGGVVLRLAYLNVPMAYDESYSFVNFASQPVYLAIGEYNSTNNHLLNTLGMHVCYQIFGQQDWALRLPVFVCGLMLLPAVWFWARERGEDRLAIVTLALVAVAPALVSYSVNARGYIYVTLSAVVLDLALLRIARAHPHRRFNWFAAWFAVVFGCCAMPLMVYPLVGICGWYLLLPSNAGNITGRLRSLALLAASTIPAVLIFYTPAFVFRGLLFLHDPIVQSVPFGVAVRQLADVWLKAFEWWTVGPIFWQVWLVFLVAGCVRWIMTDRSAQSLAFPFVAAGILMIIQQVTPPPRILLYLTPWVMLLVAGVFGPKQTRQDNRVLPSVLAVLILFSGAGYSWSRPVLFEESERINYVAIPDAVSRLAAEIRSQDAGQHRLIAPLPCDLPSIYYMRKRGFEIPVNGEPHHEETVWLLARKGEQPADVLRSSLVSLGDRVHEFESWVSVQDWGELGLYRSQLKFEGTARNLDLQSVDRLLAE